MPGDAASIHFRYLILTDGAAFEAGPGGGAFQATGRLRALRVAEKIAGRNGLPVHYFLRVPPIQLCFGSAAAFVVENLYGVQLTFLKLEVRDGHLARIAFGRIRFAVEGNALFGQWTYGGKGLVPEQQRKDLGDHRIAAFDWPFDSVRGYFINLMSHPAYEDFRRLRAELRARGEPLTSMALADGLIKYSERGQEYVDTLKGIIRVNGLAIADDAVFRDEPLRFVVGAEDEVAAAVLRQEVERMRASGELTQIVDRMRLE